MLRRPMSYCSFACTPQSMATLVNTTGIVDRWMEAVAEATYGQLSFSWDVTITDTLWIPKSQGGKADTNGFSYRWGRSGNEWPALWFAVLCCGVHCCRYVVSTPIQAHHTPFAPLRSPLQLPACEPFPGSQQHQPRH